MKQFWTAFVVTMFALSALAIDPLVTQANIPTTYPLYNSNSVYPKISNKFNFPSNGLPVASGQMATNAVPRVSTNSTSIWGTAIFMQWYDSFDLVVTANAASNTFVSNYFLLYPTHDMVTIDSNDVIVLGPFTNIIGTSNLIVNTNINANQGPQNIAGYFLGCGNPGTNSITNLFAQVVCKEKEVITVYP